VQAPPGVPVGTLLARGEVELGFQQRSELMHLAGIEVLGPMPPGLEIVTTFSGAVCAAASRPAAARALLQFLRSPAAAETTRRHGMQPT
jgi:molybdate transport system substrate-binding protein